MIRDCSILRVVIAAQSNYEPISDAGAGNTEIAWRGTECRMVVLIM